MDLIFKYAWIMFIVVTIANGIVFNRRSQKYIKENPELEPGYDKLIKGWLIYGNIPWVIMALGDISGMTNGTFDYFYPRSMNPMVLTFHLSIIMIWLLGTNWIFLRNGAAFLAKHPGFINFQGPGINKDITSPTAIKIFWAIAMLGGIGGMVSMWMWDVPTMEF